MSSAAHLEQSEPYSEARRKSKAPENVAEIDGSVPSDACVGRCARSLAVYGDSASDPGSLRCFFGAGASVPPLSPAVLEYRLGDSKGNWRFPEEGGAAHLVVGHGKTVIAPWRVQEHRDLTFVPKTPKTRHLNSI